MVDGFLSMMESPTEITGPINMGNPIEFTMLELAEQILSQTNSHSTIIFKPLPSDDPKQRQPDITLAKSALNWSPKISLQDGLAVTIEYFKKTLIQ